MEKLNIHSSVDVITNSSTTIYVYQDSVKQAKELLQEILNLLGEEKKVDDLFYIDTFLEDIDHYTSRLDERDGYEDENTYKYKSLPNWSEQNEFMLDIIQKVLTEQMERPEWMKDAEKGQNCYDPDLSLYIEAKDSKYDELVKKMLLFLNSPSYNGGFDG